MSVGGCHLDAFACRRLWRAVLIGQLRLVLAGRGAWTGGHAAADVAEARAWIASPDAATVCWLAGVDPDWLLPRVARELALPRERRAISAVPLHDRRPRLDRVAA